MASAEKCSSSDNQNNISIEDEIMNDIVTNNDDNQTINISNLEYIYLIKLREFFKTNENIYKIGATKKPNLEKFNEYPQGSILYLQTCCSDSKKIKKLIIQIFKQKFIQKKHIGLDYFEGNKIEMMKIINEITDD